jgi:hypothetical protein
MLFVAGFGWFCRAGRTINWGNLSEQPRFVIAEKLRSSGVNDLNSYGNVE